MSYHPVPGPRVHRTVRRCVIARSLVPSHGLCARLHWSSHAHTWGRTTRRCYQAVHSHRRAAVLFLECNGENDSANRWNTKARCRLIFFFKNVYFANAEFMFLKTHWHGNAEEKCFSGVNFRGEWHITGGKHSTTPHCSALHRVACYPSSQSVR